MKQFIYLILAIGFFASCGSGMSLEEQAKADLLRLLPSGICDDIPTGTVLSNVVIGEIVDIGLQGMTDVSYTMDVTINGTVDQRESAMLYIKQGSRYTLASLGGNCDYEMKE